MYCYKDDAYDALEKLTGNDGLPTIATSECSGDYHGCQLPFPDHRCL